MRYGKRTTVLVAAVMGVGLMAGATYGADGTWLAEPADGNWANAANWVGGVIAGEAISGVGTTTDTVSFPAASSILTIHPDAGRTLWRMNFGASSYTIGATGGETLHFVNNGATPNPAGPRITASGAAAGTEVPVTINSPLNWTSSGHLQNDPTRPFIFNGDITSTSATLVNLSILNTTGTMTFNGSMSGTNIRYYGNGGDGRVILNNVNENGGIHLDVTRLTYELAHAGAITNASIGAGRGGNFELTAENALTGSGGISATAIYVGTLSPTNAVYGSVVRIDADNDYTGNTSVNGAAVAIDRIGLDSVTNGALWVNNGHDSAGSATGSGNVTVSGALLAGDGRIVNTGAGRGVTISNRNTAIAVGGVNGVAQGRLSPGAAEGQVGTLTLSLGNNGLNISAAVAPTDTGALIFDLNTPEASDLVDLLAGTLNIGAGVLEFDDFAFNPLSGFGIGEYTLFNTNAAINGTLGENLSGSIGDFTGTIGFSGDGQDLILTVVPEPGTLGMLAIGVMGLMARRRRMA